MSPPATAAIVYDEEAKNTKMTFRVAEAKRTTKKQKISKPNETEGENPFFFSVHAHGTAFCGTPWILKKIERETTPKVISPTVVETK